MREKFCPKCGKKTEKLYEGFCEKCFLSKFSLSKKLPKSLEIKKCRSCGKFIFKNYFSSIENLIEAFLQEFLKEEEITSISYRINSDKIFLRIEAKINDLEKIEERTIELRMKKIICQACSMKSSGYFQTILQVRAPQNLLEEIKHEIEDQISYLNQYDSLAFISRFEEMRNGFDVFIGSKNSANQIASFLKTKYKAKLKITRKIAGKLRGKKVYRDTILISISNKLKNNI